MTQDYQNGLRRTQEHQEVTKTEETGSVEEKEGQGYDVWYFITLTFLAASLRLLS